MRIVRWSVTATLFVGLVLATTDGAADAAPGPRSREVIVADWGDATFVAKRFGWDVRVRVTTDEYEGERRCVYAKVALDVAGGPDPKNDHVAEACNVNENVTQVVWLRPGLGTEIRRLKIALCQPDLLADSCESATMPVWQNLAEHPELRPRADKRMNESMAAFQRNRRAEVGPWDWGSDGCSGPALRKRLFRNACERHDFGYRNYGNGLTVGPFDQTRAWIDSRFRSDMNRICERRYSGGAETGCRRAAATNHGGVRFGGARAFFG